MPNYLCHACNRTTDDRHTNRCPKCHRILCDSCRGSASYCKDSKKGTAGCDGRWEKV
jgi:hypothetical protein